MRFPAKLTEGRLIKRYQRFLADILLTDGRSITAHCPNSGSMKTCAEPGFKVLLSEHNSPARKYCYTWEMAHNGESWIGINTGIPNRIAEEAVRAGGIPELAGYPVIAREKKYGRNSRIDLLLTGAGKDCFVEVKNVTLVEKDGYCYFPDAVTERGRKHLHELMTMAETGHRAVMLFVVQRRDGHGFRPAVHIDPEYAVALREAYRRGVEILVYRAEVTPEKIELSEAIPWELEW